MMKLFDRIRDGTWRHDLLASLVVFLVALPLCMGIAIASGVPPEKAAAVGVMTGIIGGIVVGLFAGSPLLVTGPAAGLSVLIYELIHRFGWECMGVVILMAGLIQIIAGVFKLGQWFRAVSPAVIHGMLAGIGVLIIASQFHIMLDSEPRSSGLENLAAIPDAVYRGIMPSDDTANDIAARIGILTILILAFWKPLVPQKLKLIPAPLVAIVVATIVTVALNLQIKQVALPDSLFSAVTFPSIPALDTPEMWLSLATAAVSIAFIASAETLLSAAAVDQMHSGPRTKYDRELIAQGVGHLVSGCVGALPMTGVIVRSSVNVEAGARTNKSAILHGVWLLIFVCAFPFILRWIPTSGLAAILVYTGYKLINLKIIRKLSEFGKSEVLIYAATVVTIVATDLLTGVLVGIAMSAVKLLATLSRLNIRTQVNPANRITVLYLEGAATFIQLPKLAAALESVPPNHKLHVHFENLDYIDHACLDMLMSWEKQHRATGGSLLIDWNGLTARFREYGKNGHRRNGHPSNGTFPGLEKTEEVVAVASGEYKDRQTQHAV